MESLEFGGEFFGTKHSLCMNEVLAIYILNNGKMLKHWKLLLQGRAA